MTNFEGLIRGALAAKDATSSEVRNAIYQSSRNALKRLVESNRSMTVENVLKEQRALEDAIERIESEFTPRPVEIPAAPQMAEPKAATMEAAPAPVPVPVPVPAVENEDPLHELKQILLEDSDEFRNAHDRQVQQDKAVQDSEPAFEQEPVVEAEAPVQTSGQELPTEVPASEIQGSVDEPVSDEFFELRGEISEQATSDNNVAPEPFAEPENLPLEFAKRRRSQKRFAWMVVSVAIIALLGWLGYFLYNGVMEGMLFGLNDRPPQSQNAANDQNASSGYITVLEPGDLSSLVTANRGQAEIVNELNLEMIRLLSVRNDADRSLAAEPILLRLKPGVIEQISGKTVTFEIYAKSGSSSPAQFTVKCQFGELGNCGRKRFRVGLQPEASIFAFEMGNVNKANQSAFIALSTDITEQAAITGKGDAIDIVYARLRAN